jgi:hypothetical protein
MPLLGFERAKIVHALDRAATMIGVTISHISKIYFNTLLLPRILEIISSFVILQTKVTRICNPLLMSRPSIRSCFNYPSNTSRSAIIYILNADYTEWLLIMSI